MAPYDDRELRPLVKTAVLRREWRTHSVWQTRSAVRTH